MPSWTSVLEADLATVISTEELELYRERATSAAGVDPVPALIENAVMEARDRIRANASNLLAPGATIPTGMKGRVLVMIRQRVLTICKVAIGEDRKAEYEAAERYFRDVAEGKVAVPKPDDVTDETPPPRPRPRYQKTDRTSNAAGI